MPDLTAVPADLEVRGDLGLGAGLRPVALLAAVVAEVELLHGLLATLPNVPDLPALVALDRNVHALRALEHMVVFCTTEEADVSVADIKLAFLKLYYNCN